MEHEPSKNHKERNARTRRTISVDFASIGAILSYVLLPIVCAGGCVATPNAPSSAHATVYQGHIQNTRYPGGAGSPEVIRTPITVMTSLSSVTSPNIPKLKPGFGQATGTYVGPANKSIWITLMPLGRSPNEWRKVRTDKFGNWVIPNVKPGRYCLLVLKSPVLGAVAISSDLAGKICKNVGAGDVTPFDSMLVLD